MTEVSYLSDTDISMLVRALRREAIDYALHGGAHMHEYARDCLALAARLARVDIEVMLHRHQQDVLVARRAA